MGVFKVEIAVATCRPPKTDAFIAFAIEADNGHDAELTALQWAASHPQVVMPVGSVVIDWPEDSGS